MTLQNLPACSSWCVHHLSFANWPSLLLSNLSSPCLRVPCMVHYRLLTLALLIGTRVSQALAMRLPTAKHGEHCQLGPSLGCALSSLPPILQCRPPAPVTHAPSFNGGACSGYLIGTWLLSPCKWEPDVLREKHACLSWRLRQKMALGILTEGWSG